MFRILINIASVRHFLWVLIIWASLWENRLFAYAKTKTQISFTVTAKLISAFVFATQILQSLYFLNPKFQASSHLLWLYSPVCMGPGQKPRRPVFSPWGSYDLFVYKEISKMSLVMRKPGFCICGNREADQRLCFRYIDSTIPLLPIYEISSL